MFNKATKRLKEIEEKYKEQINRIIYEERLALDESNWVQVYRLFIAKGILLGIEETKKELIEKLKEKKTEFDYVSWQYPETFA